MGSNESSDLSVATKKWLKGKIIFLIIGLIFITTIVILFWGRVVITIESGHAGVLFRRFSGTEIDHVYGEGLHIFNPLDKLHIYDVRKKIAFHEFSVISNKGLSITLSLAIRYRPEYELLGILHQKIGPDFLHSVIIPQIESVMRKQLGSYSAEQIYTNEEGLLTNAILIALDEVGRNYVEVDEIIIRSIELPKDIVTAIESKLKKEEQMKSYEFRLQIAKKEAERLLVEAEGIKHHNDTINSSLTEAILRSKGIAATEKLASSPNAKVVVIGGGKDGLPLILNADSSAAETQAPTEAKTKSQRDAAESMVMPTQVESE